MIVVLDINAIFNDWELQKPSFQLLCKYAKLSQDLHIIVPDIVFQEAVARYKREVHNHLIARTKAVRSLRGFLPSSHYLPVIQPVDQELNTATTEYAMRLRSRIEKIGCMPTHRDIPVQDLLDRSLSRRRPFKDHGRGFRDALIWEVVLRKVVTEGEATFLVSSNHKDFAKDNDNQLHPGLVHDLEDRNLPPESLQLVESVDSLVADYIKRRLHSTDAVPGLREGTHKDFHLVEWFKENREEIGESMKPESFLHNISPLHLDDPTVSYVEDPDTVEVNDIYELDNERAFVGATARAETRFQFFVDKMEYYLRDEVPIEIEDSDWNESVMLGAVSLCLPIGLSIVYNARHKEVEEFEVIIPEIFGFCGNCSTPVLSDAAESCSDCGRHLF